MKRRRGDITFYCTKYPRESSDLLNWIEDLSDIATHMLFGLMYTDQVDDVNTTVTLSLVSKFWNRKWKAALRRICPYLTSEFRIVCSQVEAFADKMDPRRPVKRLLDSFFDAKLATDKAEMRDELVRMLQAPVEPRDRKLKMDIPPFNPSMGRGWFDSWRNLVLWARTEWDATYIREPRILVVPYGHSGLEALFRDDHIIPAFINRLWHMDYPWFCPDDPEFDWDEYNERDPIRLLCESITPHIDKEEAVALMHIIRYTQASAPPLGHPNSFPPALNARQRKLEAGDMGELLWSLSDHTYNRMSGGVDSVSWKITSH